MGFLRRCLRKASYHREQRLRRGNRQQAWRGQLGELFCQVSGLHRDDAFHASADPHHAHRADTGLPGHSREWQLEPVERVRRVDDANGLRCERGYLNGGIVLEGF
jgi:hypothetical protein